MCFLYILAKTIINIHGKKAEQFERSRYAKRKANCRIEKSEDEMLIGNGVEW